MLAEGIVLINQDLEQLIGESIEKTELTKKLSIGGETSIYPVYKIPVDFLYYNDQNGRINTVYHQHIAEKGKVTPELGESPYNTLFENFIYGTTQSEQKQLEDTQANIEEKGQEEPGVVLRDGRVIDGNRRLTAIRRFQRKSGVPKYFEATILPLNIDNKIDKKKIKELELDLQLGRETRKSYDPIDRIFDVYNTVKVEKTMNIEEYKIASGAKSTRKINKDLRLADLIIEFLRIVSPGGNIDNKFYLARELKLDGPIEDIEPVLSKLKDDKNNVTEIVLTTLAAQIASEDADDGDTTRKIRDIKKNILNNPDIKTHYVDATENHVDTLIDYFEENPISDAKDLKKKINENPKIVNEANKLIESTNRLSRKGEKDTSRRQSLTQLQDIRDNLQEMKYSDLKELKQDEFDEAKDVLVEIRDLIFKLQHGGDEE